jgi:hypothetical protein
MPLQPARELALVDVTDAREVNAAAIESVQWWMS